MKDLNKRNQQHNKEKLKINMINGKEKKSVKTKK
jgi:hypothetical protein